MPVLHAPAKINLTLEILGRRPDGYHRLRSVAVPISLYDEITVEPGGRGIEFRSNSREIQTYDNLVVKALAALEAPQSNFKIFLKKCIPIGAGLGGGSSDAAAILLASMQGVFGKLGRRDYLAIARRLGSDVPFFLTQTAAIVEGTGERITPLGAVPRWGCTILRPPLTIATADAYRQFFPASNSRPRDSSATIELGEALQRSELARVQTLAQNDFEPWAATQYPDVAVALKALSDWNGGFAHLTGSGSCVYTIYEHVPQAPLEFPEGFERFDAGFVGSAVWRSQSA